MLCPPYLMQQLPDRISINIFYGSPSRKGISREEEVQWEAEKGQFVWAQVR